MREFSEQFKCSGIVCSSGILFRAESADMLLFASGFPFFPVSIPGYAAIVRQLPFGFLPIGVIHPSGIAKVFNAVIAAVSIYMIKTFGDGSEMPKPDKAMRNIKPLICADLPISIRGESAGPGPDRSPGHFVRPFKRRVFPQKPSAKVIIKQIFKTFLRDHIHTPYQGMNIHTPYQGVA